MKKIAFIGTLAVCIAFSGCAAQTAGSAASSAQSSPASSTAQDSASEAASSSSSTAASSAGQSSLINVSTGNWYDAVNWPEADIPDAAANADYNAGSATAVPLSGDQDVTISKGGTYYLTGSLTNAQVIVDADKDKDEVRLILDGVSITCSDGPAIWIKSADLTVITLAGDSTLTDGSTYAAEGQDNAPNACLFSKDDLVINGAGNLTVKGNYKHGICSKDDLYLLGTGTITVDSVKDAIRGVDSLTALSGSYNLTSGQDALKSSQDADTEKGWMYIGGGNYNISAGDDAVHAETELRIVDCTMDITSSYEGLEAQDIAVEGGTISIVSSDDGLNAAGGNDSSGFGGRGGDAMGSGSNAFGNTDGCLVAILGGTLTVNAGGDGLDSNGNLYIGGGDVTVWGPTDSGNGAIDYGDGSYQFLMTGGSLLAVGASGMAEGSDASSTQPGILVNTDAWYDGGSTVTLTNASGQVIYTATPEKTYNSIFLSCPDMVDGESYTLSVDGTELATLTLDGGLTTSGNVGMGGGMGGGMGHGGQRPDGTMPGDAGMTPPDGQRPDGTTGATPDDGTAADSTNSTGGITA